MCDALLLLRNKLERDRHNKLVITRSIIQIIFTGLLANFLIDNTAFTVSWNACMHAFIQCDCIIYTITLLQLVC